MKEQGKDRLKKNKLNELYISKHHEKNFRVLAVNLIQDLRKKSWSQRSITYKKKGNTEIEDLMVKQKEMQNTISEIENSLQGANSRIEEAKEKVSKVKDRLVEITDAEN